MTRDAKDVVGVDGWRRVHMIGIGGAGMSGIAKLLLARGVAVTGSDLKDSAALHALEALGATVFVGHRSGQIGDPDAVVVSAAIPAANVEVVEARRRGIPVVGRAQVLAGLMRGTRAIAIAGTHGKTTTTSMIAVMLTRLGLDPTYVIGGDLNDSGSGAVHGTGDLFVAEADESDRSLLLLEPEVAVLTNVELDHPDAYASQKDVERTFAEFARRASVVVACWDDDGVRRAVAAAGIGRVIRYGRCTECDVRLTTRSLTASSSVAAVEVDGSEFELRLGLPGSHNVLNAGAALAVAWHLGLPLPDAAAALGTFGGVRRRFERKGSIRGADFVDDYAHHPTEVAATLEAARLQPHRRVVAVFQPHRYTRTKAMWRALGESLRAADVAVVTDVYPAGEQPIPGVTGRLLVQALAEAVPGRRVVYLPRRSDVAPFLAREVRPGDLVVTLGAGDITMVGEEILERLRGAT